MCQSALRLGVKLNDGRRSIPILRDKQGQPFISYIRCHKRRFHIKKGCEKM